MLKESRNCRRYEVFSSWIVIWIFCFSQLPLTLWFVSVGKHWDCSEPFGLIFVQPFYMWLNCGLIGQIQHPIHKFYFYYYFCWSLLHLRLLLQNVILHFLFLLHCILCFCTSLWLLLFSFGFLYSTRIYFFWIL